MGAGGRLLEERHEGGVAAAVAQRDVEHRPAARPLALRVEPARARKEEAPVPAGRAKPDMGTVTVSRRGVINVRLGWHDGVEWEGNEEWIGLVDAIRDLLLTLC